MSNESSYCDNRCLEKANRNIGILISMRRSFQNPFVAARDLGILLFRGSKKPNWIFA